MPPTALTTEAPMPITTDAELEIVKQVESLSMLIYGDSKAGKSLFSVSTRPPRLFIDAESAAKHLPLRATVWDPKDPPPEASDAWDTCVVIIRTWQDAEDVMGWLLSGNHPFRSISLDSVSELQYKCVDKVAGRAQVQLQMWGTVLRLLGGWLRDLRDLTEHPTNPVTSIVITSMSKIDQDGWTRPYLQGQLADQLPYLWDVIAYIEVDEDEDGGETRRLITRKNQTRRILAGERVQGRIAKVFQLPDVSGPTKESIAAKNKTFELLRRSLYKTPAKPKATPVTPTTEDTPVDTEKKEQ